MNTWREALFTASEMRLAEERYEGETLELMERAGRACAEAAVARFPHATRWAVHCGSGANGGDGFVVARHLDRLGRAVSLVLHASTDRLSGDTSANYLRCTALGIQPVESWHDADGVVDALLGTGYEGELRPGVAAVIDEINGHGCPVVSVDIPSGVAASTGEVDTTAVRADLTVTFHARKVGHVVAPGSRYVGQLVVADIGLDPVADSTTETACGHVSDAVVAAIPVRGARDNKYTAGSVLIVGGSTGMTGAPALSALAALRTGAGLVSMCVPQSLNHVFELQTLEVMTRPCDDEGGTLTEQALDAIVEASERAGAVVVGPGLGRSVGVQRLVRGLLQHLTVPVVLDADGLWALGDQLDVAAGRTAASTLR